MIPLTLISLISLISLFGATVAMMLGPYESTTALNSPNCNLPSPSGSSTICAVNGTLPDALACAAACAVSGVCTAYTWHDATQGSFALACVFRLDGAWEPLTGATGHVSGRKVPSNPATWPITDGFDALPVMWFGANTSGLDSVATLTLIAKHRVGGYGWQQGTETLAPADNLGRGEVHLAAAATHLADFLGPQGTARTLVFVYRQIQVALQYFAAAQTVAADPANDQLFLHDANTGALCTAAQPWGTRDPFWNMSNPDSVSAWLSSVVAEVASEADIGVAAVFFDEVDQGFCGYWDAAQAGCGAQSASLQAALQAGNNGMLTQLVSTLNAAGIVPLLSLDNRMAASGAGLNIAPPCALPEDATIAALQGLTWARFYENWPGSFWVPDSAELHAAMVQNAILEGLAGVPVLLHTDGGPACPSAARNITRPGPLGGDIEYAVASFLVVQTPGSVISMSNDWYDQNFCWRSEFDVLYGSPLGPASRTGPYTWFRNFTRCNVTLNTQTGSGAVYLL